VQHSHEHGPVEKQYKPLSCRQLLVSFRDGDLRPEHLEHDAVPLLEHQGKNMWATLTEPIMPHAVDSAWQISC
jgi:hypothetical protein